jgi:predicted transposase/invertase (TIGR01784 family)
MLLTEWNWDDALAVSKEEGWEEGREEGREEGEVRKAEEIAKNALIEGASVEFIRRITGLDPETIRNLSLSQN